MVRLMSRRTGAGEPAYSKLTPSKAMVSRKPSTVRAPGRSATAGGASRISKTRSTEPVVCCTVFIRRASWRAGPYSMITAAMNEKKTPGVRAPLITW